MWGLALCARGNFKTPFTAVFTMRPEESLFSLSLLKRHLFWHLSWCLIKDLKCVQPDTTTAVNFAIASVAHQKLLVAICFTQKYRFCHTKLLLYVFFMSAFPCTAQAPLSQCWCSRSCSRANSPPACLIWWRGTTSRGCKLPRQSTGVPISVNCCHCSLIWTPVHWEPARDRQTNLTETSE